MPRFSVVHAAVYTALTFVATVLLVVETPATGGYFNLGEAAIYTLALTSGRLLETAVAAGLGPALADLLMGYWYFAPATFIIKFTEGYVVARLASRLGDEGGLRIRLATLSLGVLLACVAGLLAFVNPEQLLRFQEVYASVQPPELIPAVIAPVVDVVMSPTLWLVVAVAAAALSIAVGFGLAKPTTLAMMLGGLIMVTGYFLYEFLVSNPLILGRTPIAALAEVPVNIGQALVGLIVAYPVAEFVRRAKGATRG